MDKKNISAIGVMSGTSLDGVDLVYVVFNKEDYSDFKILKAETVQYSDDWRFTLQNAIHSTHKELQKLDLVYGEFLGEIINKFIQGNSIQNINFIASHGHTILHQPQNGITLQIGNGNEIARITQIKVVCDFRSQDVKLGGQGAPLVPIGDALLFSNYRYCLNLGGFSNISFQKKNQRVAFDICPVNIVLNHYTNKMGLAYDASGKIAAAGKVNNQLLQRLNELDFYKKGYPKSLGLEWVQQHVFPLIDELESDIPSILRTFVEHIAIQVSKIINHDSLLITGGGAFNSFLMHRLEAKTKIKILIPNEQLIDFKEALIFAFLGLLRIDNQINCLASVTGASKDHSSGVIFYP